MFRVLIAEDDAELRELFAHVLRKSGYEVGEAADGAQALDRLSQCRYDLLISDIMMPHVDGNALVRRLREQDNYIPVLLITAKSAFDDMQAGFSDGADDYMVKPVNVYEMVLRVGALLRRATSMREHRVRIGETVLEYDSFSMITQDRREILPQKEFQLLYKMASFPGKIFTKQQLMDDIWGYETYTDCHTVEVHIGRLREKLANNRDLRIVTMRGIGYKVELI